MGGVKLMLDFDLYQEALKAAVIADVGNEDGIILQAQKGMWSNGNNLHCKCGGILFDFLDPSPRSMDYWEFLQEHEPCSEE